MAYLKKTWNGLGHSAVEDTHQYAQRAQNKPGRNKYKCVHYDPETGLCEMNNIGCVGPSNSLCQDYCTDPSAAKQPPHAKCIISKPSLRPPVPKKSSPKIQPISKTPTASKQVQPSHPVSQPNPSSPVKPKFDPSSVSVGMTVKHIGAGKGTVTKINPAAKTITVMINGTETNFLFPGAFLNGYLKVVPQDDNKK